VHLPGSSPVSSAFPTLMSGRLPASFRERDFSRGKFSRLQLFRYVQASELACLPDRSYRCRFPRRAAEAFTSEQNVRRYLRTHRICSPPDYRQLAARGLSPREIHSIVDCSKNPRAPAVGAGLPHLPFRLQGGFTIPPWLRFAGPPDNPGRPVFPGPVRNRGISSMGLPNLARFKR